MLVDDVTGLWAGQVGNDGSYLDLTQSGGTVTGTACEAPGKPCYPLVGGSVAGDTFTAAYSWDEGGKTQTVTMTMKVAADNRSMQGTYVSTKGGGCTLQASLGKQSRGPPALVGSPRTIRSLRRATLGNHGPERSA